MASKKRRRRINTQRSFGREVLYAGSKTFRSLDPWACHNANTLWTHCARARVSFKIDLLDSTVTNSTPNGVHERIDRSAAICRRRFSRNLTVLCDRRRNAAEAWARTRFQSYRKSLDDTRNSTNLFLSTWSCARALRNN